MGVAVRRSTRSSFTKFKQAVGRAPRRPHDDQVARRRRGGFVDPFGRIAVLKQDFDLLGLIADLLAQPATNVRHRIGLSQPAARTIRHYLVLGAPHVQNQELGVPLLTDLKGALERAVSVGAEVGGQQDPARRRHRAGHADCLLRFERGWSRGLTVGDA